MMIIQRNVRLFIEMKEDRVVFLNPGLRKVKFPVYITI